MAIFLAAMSLGYSLWVYYALSVYLANRFLGTHFHTNWDLLTRRLGVDWLGAIVGAAVLVAWDVYGWGNRRRLSGRALAAA